jgi:serine/threonine-protein kinase
MTYECLSGVRPTEAETVGRVLKRILMADFEPIERRCPDVPADVAALVRAMLTSDRAARLKDLGELRRVLAPYAAGMTPASRPAAVASASSHPPADPLARTERADSRSDTHGAVAVGPPPRRSRTRLYVGVGAVAAALSGITFAARAPSSTAASAVVPPPAPAPDPSASAPVPSLSSRPSPEPHPTASSPSPASASSSAAVRPSPPFTASAAPAAAPRCAANETLSHGHCCARGLAWDGTRCERPLATSFE